MRASISMATGCGVLLCLLSLPALAQPTGVMPPWAEPKLLGAEAVLVSDDAGVSVSVDGGAVGAVLTNGLEGIGTRGGPEAPPFELVVTVDGGEVVLPNPFQGSMAALREWRLVGDRLVLGGDLTKQKGPFVMVVDLPRAVQCAREGVSDETVEARQIDDDLRACAWGWFLLCSKYRLSEDGRTLAYQLYKPRFSRMWEAPYAVWAMDVTEEALAPKALYPAATRQESIIDGMVRAVFGELQWTPDGGRIVFIDCPWIVGEGSQELPCAPSDRRLVVIDVSGGLDAPDVETHPLPEGAELGMYKWAGDGVLAVYSTEPSRPGVDAEPMYYLNLRGERVLLTAMSGED